MHAYPNTPLETHQSMNRPVRSGQSDLLGYAAKGAAMLGGAAVLLEILRHRRLLMTAAAAGAGALLMQHFVSGSYQRRGRPRKLSQNIGSPSFQHDDKFQSTQEPMDEVDEAVMESFPASDAPPSYRRA